MESYEDDDLALPIPVEPSSPFSMPKLKRLKKGASTSSPHPENRCISDVAASPISSGAADNVEIRMNSSYSVGNEDIRGETAAGLNLDPLFSYPRIDQSWDALDRLVREVNEAGCPSIEPESEEETRKENSVKRRLSLEEDEEDPNKRKKRKGKSIKVVGRDGKPEESVREKRKLEKSRKAELEQLHAESQRLLRETRDASFKPLKLFHKPVSSVLEKIRLRKQEMLKSSSILSRTHSMDETDISEGCSNVNSGRPLCQSDVKGKAENAKEDSDVGFKGVYQDPTNDTQEYATESHLRTGDKHMTDGQKAISVSYLAASNFKVDDGDIDDDLDTAGDDNTSLSEDENDKENVDPTACHAFNLDCSPKDGFAKAFVDDEAEEEDDSDHDLLRFQENEDEYESDEIEELYELVATGNEEAPKDQEKRHELHQKWLEQQDAAETDNVLQRLKCGRQVQEPAFLHDNCDDDGVANDDDGDDEYAEDDNETANDQHPADTVRHCLKKAKQMIAQMFTDASDVYIPSDDEETEKHLIRHHILKQNEETSLVSSLEDEYSSEVFGRIKKLNLAPVTKKIGKASTSVFDSLLVAGNSNSSSKPSFINRTSNSLSSYHKQGSSSVKTFIFGRDDSNSRNSISTSEIISDKAQKERTASNTANAKSSNSTQQKPSITKTKMQANSSVSGSSLFHILRQSSMQFDQKSESKYLDSKHVVTGTQVAQQFSAFKVRGRGRSSKMGSRI